MEYLLHTIETLLHFFFLIWQNLAGFLRMLRKVQLNFFRISITSTPKKAKICEEQKFEYDMKDFYPSMDLGKHFPSLFTDSHLNFRAEFQYSAGSDFFMAEV